MNSVSTQRVKKAITTDHIESYARDGRSSPQTPAAGHAQHGHKKGPPNLAVIPSGYDNHISWLTKLLVAHI